MALPVNVRDIMSSSAKIKEEREKPVRIELWVEADAPEPLVTEIRGILVPETSAARLHHEVVEQGRVFVPDPMADLVIGVVGSGRAIPQSLQSARENNMPTAAVVWTDSSAQEWSQALGHPLRDTLASSDREHLLQVVLGDWLADNIHGKRLALANNFSFMRRAIAVEAVKSTAAQNAAVGAAPFFPGGDFPIMTANQMKMILQIAAAYGQPLSAQRIRELMAVLGGSFVFRAAARTLIGWVPVVGWAVRGGIGYSGTMAMGYGAIEYFEAGGTASGLTTKIKDVTARLKRGRPREVIDGTVVSVDDVVEPLQLPAQGAAKAGA
jgi:uncharacterized protein (DUF697 family)